MVVGNKNSLRCKGGRYKGVVVHAVCLWCYSRMRLQGKVYEEVLGK